MRSQKDELTNILKGIQSDTDKLKKAKDIEAVMTKITEKMTFEAGQMLKQKLQQQAELDQELADAKKKNDIQNRLIDEENDRIKALERLIAELNGSLRDKQKHQQLTLEALEKERKAKLADQEKKLSLQKRLQELKAQFQKQQQDLNFDQTDDQIHIEHATTRNALYEITTGTLYTEWKNTIVDDNLK